MEMLRSHLDVVLGSVHVGRGRGRWPTSAILGLWNKGNVWGTNMMLKDKNKKIK